MERKSLEFHAQAYSQYRPYTDIDGDSTLSGITELQDGSIGSTDGPRGADCQVKSISNSGSIIINWSKNFCLH